jgi:hypothetical protein
LDAWIATLSIATRHLFDDICECAIKEIIAQLDSIDTVNVIVVAYKLHVHAWLEPAFRMLVERNEVVGHCRCVDTAC